MAREFNPTGDERLDRLQRVLIAAVDMRPTDKPTVINLAAAVSNPKRLFEDIESLRAALTRTPKRAVEDFTPWPRKS